MGPKLAIALPANLPDCAGDSPIAQPDADRQSTAACEPPLLQQHFAAPFDELEAHPLAPSHPEADKLLTLYRNLDPGKPKSHVEKANREIPTDDLWQTGGALLPLFYRSRAYRHPVAFPLDRSRAYRDKIATWHVTQ